MWDKIMGVGPKKEVITQIGFICVRALLDIGWLNETFHGTFRASPNDNHKSTNSTPRAESSHEMASGHFSWQVLAFGYCHNIYILCSAVTLGDSAVTFLSQLQSVADHHIHLSGNHPPCSRVTAFARVAHGLYLIKVQAEGRLISAAPRM